MKFHRPQKPLLRLAEGVFLVLLSSSFALSQELPPSDSLDTIYLDEIVVTATRVSGEIFAVPMAVGVVDGRDFAKSRNMGLADALWAMPGVVAQSRAGGQDVRLTVRGFGARGNGDRSNAATIRGIKVLVDGIPETEPDGRTSLDMIDLSSVERIEVVRSNASTLFGNASGGVVNIETVPFFRRPFLSAKNIFGSYGLRRNSILAGIPLSYGRVAFAATSSAFDGWRQHSSSENLSARVSFVVDGSNMQLSLILSAADNEFAIPGPLTNEQYRSDPAAANPTYLVRRERRHNRVARVSAQLAHSFSDQHKLEALVYVGPKALRRSERNTYRDFNRYHLGAGLLYHWTASDGLIKRITAGLDEAFQDGSILFYSLSNGDRGDSLRTNKREGAETFGLFTQIELDPFDRTSIVLGGRFDQQRYLSENYPAGRRVTSTKEQLSFRHFTPRVSLLYRIAQQHSVYVSVSGGLEAPAFNEVDPPPTLPNVELNPFLKPMTSTTFEIGTKGIFLTSGIVRGFSYSVAAYMIAIRNEIVPRDGGAWFLSAGRSERLGVEVGNQIDLLENFTIKSALTLLKGRYTSFENELGNFAGHLVPGIPPVVFNNRIRYQRPDGFSAEAGVEYIGEYVVDDENLHSVPRSLLVHGTISHSVRVGMFTITVFGGVQNILNNQVVASAFINPTVRNASGNRILPAYIEPSLPRNFFVGADLKATL
ncbi:MAG TPA: TonB-dependent receptor [Bacteroidota bacterium]|nr:TonB-dependent receptor [Bacteroidota bacterium]